MLDARRGRRALRGEIQLQAIRCSPADPECLRSPAKPGVTKAEGCGADEGRGGAGLSVREPGQAATTLPSASALASSARLQVVAMA